MKTRKWILLVSMFYIAPIFTKSQCVDPLQSLTLDTTLIGTGNAFHTFSFPKFDASLGTLVGVKIESEVTLTYSFQLENRESITINNYRVRVTRDDEISSNALINPITNTRLQTYGPYSLTAYDGMPGTGTDYINRGPLYVMNHQLISNTVFNTGDFLGAGTVDFDYSSTTYSSVLGSVNYTFNATAEDTIHFSVTYLYCASWFLNADITSFTAFKNNSSAVSLQWITQNELPDRHYELQKSNDGTNFTTVDYRKAVPDATSTGTYQARYSIKTSEKGKLIFRIKQIEKDGTIKYSPLRVIEANKDINEGLKLFPNPSNGAATLLFNNIKRSDWQVDILGVNGNLIQRLFFNNALQARLNLNKQLQRGIYFLKVTNRQNNQQWLEKLVIQ